MRAERRRCTSERHEVEAQGGLADRHPGGARDAQDRGVGAVAPAQRRPGQARRRRKVRYTPNHGTRPQNKTCAVALTFVRLRRLSRIMARKPKDVWAVRLAAGMYLLDGKFFRPLDAGEDDEEESSHGE